MFYLQLVDHRAEHLPDLLVGAGSDLRHLGPDVLLQSDVAVAIGVHLPECCPGGRKEKARVSARMAVETHGKGGGLPGLGLGELGAGHHGDGVVLGDALVCRDLPGPVLVGQSEETAVDHHLHPRVRGQVRRGLPTASVGV